MTWPRNTVRRQGKGHAGGGRDAPETEAVLMKTVAKDFGAERGLAQILTWESSIGPAAKVKLVPLIRLPNEPRVSRRRR